jgi:hypothetical protein
MSGKKFQKHRPFLLIFLTLSINRIGIFYEIKMDIDQSIIYLVH